MSGPSPLTDGYVERRMDLLHPLFETRARAFIAAVRELRHDIGHFEVFETWRSPSRQRALLQKTAGVTKVGPWYSSHQYGLALDLVRRAPDGSWRWDGIPASTWVRIHAVARLSGLRAPHAFDPYHIEAPEWPEIIRLVRDKLDTQSDHIRGG